MSYAIYVECFATTDGIKTIYNEDMTDYYEFPCEIRVSMGEPQKTDIIFETEEEACEYCKKNSTEDIEYTYLENDINLKRCAFDNEIKNLIDELMSGKREYSKNLLSKKDAIKYIKPFQKNKQLFLVSNKEMVKLVNLWQNSDNITDEIKKYCYLNANNKYEVNRTLFVSFENDGDITVFDNTSGDMYGETYSSDDIILALMWLDGLSNDEIDDIKFNTQQQL